MGRVPHSECMRQSMQLRDDPRRTTVSDPIADIYGAPVESQTWRSWSTSASVTRSRSPTGKRRLDASRSAPATTDSCRWAAAGVGRAAVAGRPRRSADDGQAEVPARRTGCDPARPGGRGGALLAGLQARPRPAQRRGRRDRRVPDPFPDRADRLLPKPASSPRSGPIGSWPLLVSGSPRRWSVTLPYAALNRRLRSRQRRPRPLTYVAGRPRTTSSSPTAAESRRR